jgi:hypothetical protein
VDLAKSDLPEKWDLVHAAIGGGICFIILLLGSDFAQGIHEQVLVFFNIIGVMFYQEQYGLARSIIMFGSLYLLSGFCGGIYAGYKVENGLSVILAIPGLIGFTTLALLSFFLGQFDVSGLNILNLFLIPLLGDVIGSYLGGYAISWPSREEKEETAKS